jgi:hypothetical protein
MGFRVEDIPVEIKKAGVWLEEPLGAKEWAWPYSEAMKLVEYLTNHDFVILGGEVLEKNNELEYETSSWSHNIEKKKIWSQNVRESKSKALKYIDFFHAKNGERYLYTISAIASAIELERIRQKWSNMI